MLPRLLYCHLAGVTASSLVGEGRAEGGRSGGGTSGGREVLQRTASGCQIDPATMMKQAIKQKNIMVATLYN